MLDPAKADKLWRNIYSLSLMMLHHPEDAEDATQEIMEKALKNADRFEGRSSAETWIGSIARNHLKDRKRKRFNEAITFEAFERDVADFKPYAGELGLNALEEKMYADQVKRGCTLAMLQCLDEESRFVYILGTVFPVSGREGAAICGISSEAFRQKLSRARNRIGNFMKGNCGLINPDAFCKCRKRLLIATQRGRISPDGILKKASALEEHDIKGLTAEMEAIDDEAVLFRSLHGPGVAASAPRDLIKRYRILRTDA